MKKSTFLGRFISAVTLHRDSAQTGSNDETKRLIEMMGHYQQQTFHLGGTGPIIRNGSQRFTGIARARREAKKRRNIRARSSKR